MTWERYFDSVKEEETYSPSRQIQSSRVSSRVPTTPVGTVREGVDVIVDEWFRMVKKYNREKGVDPDMFKV